MNVTITLTIPEAEELWQLVDCGMSEFGWTDTGRELQRKIQSEIERTRESTEPQQAAMNQTERG